MTPELWVELLVGVSGSLFSLPAAAIVGMVVFRKPLRKKLGGATDIEFGGLKLKVPTTPDEQEAVFLSPRTAASS